MDFIDGVLAGLAALMAGMLVFFTILFVLVPSDEDKAVEACERNGKNYVYLIKEEKCVRFTEVR